MGSCIEHTIELARRHHGVHRVIGTCMVRTPGSLVRWKPEEAVLGRRLLELLPRGFLPEKPSRVLLMVGNGRGAATAARDPVRFRRWGKYFDAYSLTVEKGVRRG